MLDTDVSPDLASMSKSELEALQRQVQEALSKSEARRNKDALAALERAVGEFGLTLQDVLSLVREGGGRKAPSRRSEADAKFRNLQNPNETWSGRGRRPAWFKTHLDAGRSEEDLRV